jgi:hypothetical protein
VLSFVALSVTIFGAQLLPPGSLPFTATGSRFSTPCCSRIASKGSQMPALSRLGIARLSAAGAFAAIKPPSRVSATAAIVGAVIYLFARSVLKAVRERLSTVPPAAVMPHPSSDWWQHREERNARVHAERERAKECARNRAKYLCSLRMRHFGGTKALTVSAGALAMSIDSSLAHVNFWSVIGIAGKPHFVPRQLRKAGQSRASFCEQQFCRHRLEMDIPDAGGLVI